MERGGRGVTSVKIDRTTQLGNPFPIDGDDPTGEKRKLVCEAHRRWLQLRTVEAAAIGERRSARGATVPPTLLRADGTRFPAWMRAAAGSEHATGEQAREALRARLNDRRTARGIRFACSRDCGKGALCHGDALAELGRELVGDRDLRVQQAARAAAASGRAPGQTRKPRSDRGVRRGPREPRGPAQHRSSELSYARYRLGGERQVSDATRAAVAEAATRGVAPWNEHTTEPAVCLIGNSEVKFHETKFHEIS